MSDRKSSGQAVLGWFVEPAADASAAGAPSADGTPPSAETGPPAGDPVFTGDPPAAINGRVDFDAVYAAGCSGRTPWRGPSTARGARRRCPTPDASATPGPTGSRSSLPYQ